MQCSSSLLKFLQGSGLSKYTVCKTEDYCSWGLAGTVPGNKLTCRVDNLVAGTVVQFNVIASNGVGDSKPSDTSPMYYVIGERGILGREINADIIANFLCQTVQDSPRSPGSRSSPLKAALSTGSRQTLTEAQR